MNIRTRSKNFELTPAILDYVSKKISTLEKFLTNGENALCDVELGKTTNHHKSGDIFRAEVNLVHKGQQFYAVGEAEDLYAAIDMVRDDAERGIVSQKTKRDTLFRRGAAKIKALLRRGR